MIYNKSQPYLKYHITIRISQSIIFMIYLLLRYSLCLCLLTICLFNSTDHRRIFAFRSTSPLTLPLLRIAFFSYLRFCCKLTSLSLMDNILPGYNGLDNITPVTYVLRFHWLAQPSCFYIYNAMCFHDSSQS